MSEYDLYDSLLRKELEETHRELKEKEKEVELWKKRAYHLRKFAPMKLEIGEWL